MTDAQELCLDANIFVAALSPQEHHHKEALLLIQDIRIQTKTLYEPALVLYEVNMALYRKQRSGEMSTQDSEDLSEKFSQLPILFQWTPETTQLTHQLARQLSFTHIYDVSYLALAMMRNIPLVTFDEELLRKGKKVHRLLFGAHDAYKLTTPHS